MNYNEAFVALQKETKVELEDPLLSELHHILVEQGDYKATEEFIEHALASKSKQILKKILKSRNRFLTLSGFISSSFLAFY